MISPRPDSIDYVEFASWDISKSRRFFEDLLGWQFTDYGPDYSSFEDGRLSGGFYTSEQVSRTTQGGVLVVIYSQDLQKCRDRCVALGATISKEIFEFPGGRRFHFVEPGGGEFAIWSNL